MASAGAWRSRGSPASATSSETARPAGPVSGRACRSGFVAVGPQPLVTHSGAEALAELIVEPLAPAADRSLAEGRAGVGEELSADPLDERGVDVESQVTVDALDRVALTSGVAAAVRPDQVLETDRLGRAAEPADVPLEPVPDR